MISDTGRPNNLIALPMPRTSPLSRGELIYDRKTGYSGSVITPCMQLI